MINPTRRSFFGLIAGLAAVLGLPKPILAGIDREARRSEHLKRVRFMDAALPIIESRMVVEEAIVTEDESWYHQVKPVTYRPNASGEFELTETRDPLHVMRVSFTSNIAGAKTAMVVDTARLQTVQRLAAAGTLERHRRRSAARSIASLHWDRKIAVR